MNRRDVLLASTAALTVFAATARSAEAASGHPLLLQAIADCIAKGETCQAHCIDLLGDGDKDMADCARTVNQVIAVCTALQSLVAQKSPLVAAQARVAAEACEVCARECDKHAAHHAICKDCSDACKACLKECRALGA